MYLERLQLELLRPWWLCAILVLLPLVVYYSRRSLAPLMPGQRRLALVCRCTLIVTVVLSLCGVIWMRNVEQQFVVFVVDQSGSLDAESRSAATAYVEEAKSHAGGHRTGMLYVAKQPHMRGETVDASASNLALAVQAAAASIPAGYVGSVVLLSDGNQTMGDIRSAAFGVRMPVSTVPLVSSEAPEVAIRSVAAPAQAHPLEEIEIEVLVESNQIGSGKLEIVVADQIVSSEAVTLQAGETRLRYHVSVGKSGHTIIRARLSGMPDQRPKNNEASAVVIVTKAARVLIASTGKQAGQSLLRVLQEDGYEMSSELLSSLPDDAAMLKPYSLVVLSDASTTDMTVPQMQALRHYVRNDGGGLIAVGGHAAFEAASYKGTVLEEILPVRGYVEQQEQQSGIAMVLAIDTSKSMEKGQPESRMSLAIAAARRAVEVLDAKDQVGIISFGTDTSWRSEIRPCGNKRYVLGQIDKLTPLGTTNMYPAMEKAYLALHDTYAKRKHVIILTDGLSAPGDFHSLALAMAREGITISTVAVGKEAEQVVLQDIATAAGGRHFPCDDVSDVPDVVAKEATDITKAGIREEAFRPLVVAPSPKFVFDDFKTMPRLGGYVQTTPKTTAELILATDVGDPLLTWWRYGRGITLAFTSDASGAWANEWRSWKGFSRFWSRLARHATRRYDRQGFALYTETAGHRVTVTLDSVDGKGRFRNELDVSLKLTAVEGEQRPREHPMQRIAPGRYQYVFDAPAEGVYLAECAVREGTDVVYRETQGVAIDYGVEYRPVATNESLLRDVAEISGGVYDPAPSEVFSGVSRRATRPTALWRTLLAIAVVLLVLDLGVRRLSFGRKKTTTSSEEGAE